MKTIKKLSFIFLATFVLWSCSNDDDASTPMNPPPTLNIVQTAQANTDLSILVEAVTQAGLATTLSGTGPFTVLAPTNAAFQKFLDSNPAWNSLADIDNDVLTQVLLNHVISGTVTSGALTSAGSGYSRTMATGAGGQMMSIYYNTSAGVKFNDLATVVAADVTASNGIVHVVDEVIKLPSIVSHAQANPGLSSLVAAVTRSDQAAVLAALGGATAQNPLTVLAPVDAAFSSFLSDNGFADLAAVPEAALTATLLNHTVNGFLSSSDLTTGGAGYTNTNATGAGNNPMSIYYNTTSGVTFNGISTVAVADIVGTNGIVHAVDAVVTLPTVVTFATADPNFSTLVAALTREDSFNYVNTLMTANGNMPAPFTVFAPTNSAFDSLLNELDVASLADIETATLESTLNTHVVTGANVQASGLSDGMMIATLGGTLTANVTGGATLTDPNMRVSNIIATDVQASNGVIHAIDKVLLE